MSKPQPPASVPVPTNASDPDAPAPEAAPTSAISRALPALASALALLAVYWSLQALAYAPAMRLSWRSVLGLITAALLALVVERTRARSLGQSVGAGWPIWLALLAAAAPLGTTLPLGILAALVVVSLASARWLYGPRAAQSPLLAGLGRLPADIFFIGYGISLFGADFGWEQLVPAGGWLIAAVVFANGAHEAAACAASTSSRGQTSGRSPAVSATLLAALTCTALVMLALEIELGWPYMVGFAVLSGALVSACARAWSTPSRAALLPRAGLLYRLSVYAALIAALVATAGLGWFEGPPWYRP